MERREGALPSCPILSSTTYTLSLSLSLSLSFSLPLLASLLLSSIVSLISTLSPPTTPTSSSLSQHGSPCIVFPESSKVDGSLLIRAGYCALSAGMDELICARGCLHDPEYIYIYIYISVCVRACPEACICEHVCRNMCVCVCVWQYF